MLFFTVCCFPDKTSGRSRTARRARSRWAWPRSRGSARRSTDVLSERSESEIRCQFHQCFTCSFYARRSQKHQKDSQVKQLFALSGSSCIKAARKHIGEIDCRREGRIRRQVKKTSSVQNKMVRESGPTGIKQKFK